MVWKKQTILTRLRQLHRAGKDLSYNAMCRSTQALVSASAYHFGSYRDAVEKAGIDYRDVIRRPRWTKPAIIQLIKGARRREEDLHWSAVTRRKDELGRAAFASLQRRLFGSWDRALHAAGLDADEISCYRRWDRNTIAFELKSRAQDGDAINSAAIQQDDPGLHAAAVRYFGTYDDAIRAARIDPLTVRERRTWKRAEVIAGFRQTKKHGKRLSDSILRREHPALYGAAVRLFGSFTKARAAAGIKIAR